MAGPRRGKGRPEGRKKRVFYRRRKVCKFSAEHIEYIDFKDVNLLRQFVPERAKILPKRISGNSARHQRMLAKALKRARFLALLPYAVD